MQKGLQRQKHLPDSKEALAWNNRSIGLWIKGMDATSLPDSHETGCQKMRERERDTEEYNLRVSRLKRLQK